MTPKTQSVCKHCQQEIVQCVDYRPYNADNCKGYVHDVADAQDHYCVIDGVKTDLLAEPASTGEPPPTERFFRGDGVEEKVTYQPVTFTAAHPSEPSAPQTSAEPQYCANCKGNKIYHKDGKCIHADRCTCTQFVPAPQPVSGDAPLRISFDIGGVLSKYPEVFRPMVDALQRGGAEVFVITDMHEHEKSVRFVRDNGYDIPSERILNSDYTSHGEGCKAETIKQQGIKIHLDDFAGYCAHTECVSLFVWPNPTRPYYADDFKTDGTEGDFGRRKAAKI